MEREENDYIRQINTRFFFGFETVGVIKMNCGFRIKIIFL